MYILLARQKFMKDDYRCYYWVRQIKLTREDNYRQLYLMNDYLNMQCIAATLLTLLCYKSLVSIDVHE